MPSTWKTFFKNHLLLLFFVSMAGSALEPQNSKPPQVIGKMLYIDWCKFHVCIVLALVKTVHGKDWVCQVNVNQAWQYQKHVVTLI